MAEKSGSVLKADMHTLFEDLYGRRVDSNDLVQFIAEGRSVDLCHAWVAELHSPVIRRMLSSPMSEADTRQIQLSSNHEFVVLPAIVRFFYGFSIEICGFENAVQLLKFADFYDIAQLTTQCSAWLASQDMTPADCFQTVRELSFDDVLVNRAWSILEHEPRNMFQSNAWQECSLEMVHAVLDRGLDCSEMDILKAALHWHEHQRRSGRARCTNIEDSGDEGQHDLADTTFGNTKGRSAQAQTSETVECTDAGSADLDSPGGNWGDSVGVGATVISEDIPVATLGTSATASGESVESISDTSLGVSGKSYVPFMEDLVLGTYDPSPATREQIVPGAIVQVLEDFQSASSTNEQVRKWDVGKVQKVDEDGDAKIFFEMGEGLLWVYKEDFGKLMISMWHDQSFEEQRWQWYRETSILSFAAKLPDSLTEKILFEHMAPTELYSCKRFLPLEDYISHFEVACKVKPATRSPRTKPAQHASQAR